MLPNGEINALLTLIDDPDEEVYATVHDRLMTYGTPIIPELEDLWENTLSEEVQDRIEMIIHRIHFKNLREEFELWSKSKEPELLHGALLAAKYQYPELESLKALQEIERMRRNLWLEMNNFLTSVEQVKIVESILYNYYKMQGGEINYGKIDDFMIHKVIEKKKGNALSNSILYLILAEMIDIPVKAINIPRQFILGFFSHSALFNQSYESGSAAEKIKFFVDPNSGIAFSHKDLDQYFKRINVAPTNSYFKPVKNVLLIANLLEEFSRCFQTADNAYKKEDLIELSRLLKEEI